MTLNKLKQDLKALGNPQKAKNSSWFFKTGKGQYAEGDLFIGVTVPEQRSVAKKYKDLPLGSLEKLLNSKMHEERLTALLILVSQYRRASEYRKKSIFEFYLKNKVHVNNWDLVDLSAPNIVGNHLLFGNCAVLYKLAKSPNLWSRRISIVATWEFIKNNNFSDTFKIVEMLLNDKHDLIHKACGWMLREVGKKDLKSLEGFVDKYHKVMPRTMLRYAIERMSSEKRYYYMQKA